MSNLEPPKNGDFASYVSDLSKASASAPAPLMSQGFEDTVEAPNLQQRVQDLLNKGEPLSDEILKELDEMEELEPISDEELERQALSDPGADGDVNTPE
jgi:hypothetical protein